MHLKNFYMSLKNAGYLFLSVSIGEITDSVPSVAVMEHILGSLAQLILIIAGVYGLYRAVKRKDGTEDHKLAELKEILNKAIEKNKEQKNGDEGKI